MLTSELRKLASQPRRVSHPPPASDFRDHAAISPTISPGSSKHTTERQHGQDYQGPNQPRKRRRVDSCGNPNVDLLLPLEESFDCTSMSLPSPDLMELIIDMYFDIIQPWIPILHETQFRQRIHDQEELPNLVVVLHAIVVAALRFVESELSAKEIENIMERSRNIVVLKSMDGLSVENSQALIIIAFNDVSFAWKTRFYNTDVPDRERGGF